MQKSKSEEVLQQKNSSYYSISVYSAGKRNDLNTTGPGRAFITGFLMSGGLSFFYYFGISRTYAYMPQSVLLFIVLLVFCSLIVWINVKYDRASDVIDVFSKTISFDIEHGQPKFFKLLGLFQPLNPYAGVLGTLVGLLIVFWAIPALLLYLAIYPDSPAAAIKYVVFLMGSGTCIFYFISNKTEFPSLLHKAAFITGIVLAAWGVVELLL